MDNLKSRVLSQAALWLAAIFVSVSAVSCFGGTGTDEDDQFDGKRPSLYGLSTHTANVGDQVKITGAKFGDEQSGSAQLNGISFTIDSWSEGEIDITVVAGMSSGIVVVESDGLVSQSGAEAQLFIGAAPTGAPVINALSPDFGTVGVDQILITGANFGSSPANASVYFAAQQAVVSQYEGFSQANVVTLDIDGTLTTQWTNNSIRVWVPNDAASGDVFVVVAGRESNHKFFEAAPPPSPIFPPVITEISPANGPIGIVVTIRGDNFGQQQGSSTLTLNNLSMTVVTWGNREILAIIPDQAVNGPIRVTVAGEFDESEVFVVANTPEITGVAPSEMSVGQSLTIIGHFFGFTQGGGSLRIGGTNVPASQWNDEKIEVDALPSISGADPETGEVSVVVSADNGLSSVPFPATLISDISGKVTVTPRAGEVNVTEFTFSIVASGGSGNYEYTLIPNASNTNLTVGPQPSPAISYTYSEPGLLLSGKRQPFSTLVRIRDRTTGDVATVPGPDVLVVGTGEPVVTSIELLGYGRAPNNTPNDYSFVWNPDNPLEELYNDFVFFGGQIFFKSSLYQLEAAGVPLPGYLRDFAAFMGDPFEFPSGRPYGYRYDGMGTVSTSSVLLRGLNFGAQGELWLNSTEQGEGTLVTDINSWIDAAEGSSIEFSLPEELTSLAGYITLVRADGLSVQSLDQLIVSPLVTQILPDPVMQDGVLQIAGFDFSVPQVPGVTGGQTYIFWIVQAEYNDPFGGGIVTKQVLNVHPYPVDVLGARIEFDMARLFGAPGVDIEAYNGSRTQYTLVQGATLKQGDYKFFIWSGAMGEGSNRDIANSGIFSDAYGVTVGAGGPGGEWTVSGTVLDDMANPIANATVSIGPGMSATTLSTGFYQITNVADGSYTASASGGDGGPWNFSGTWPGAPAVDVAGADVGDIDFEGTAGGALFSAFGTVTRHKDQNPFGIKYPVPGTTITLHLGPDSSTPVIATAISGPADPDQPTVPDNESTYEFLDLVMDGVEYTVQAGDPFPGDEWVIRDSRTFTISGADQEFLTFLSWPM